MNSAGDSIFKNKKNTEPAEDISLRGKTARHLVKVANHLPVVGPLRVNGALQNLVSEHERDWKFSDSLNNTVINMDLFKMELLEKKDDEY